jgi:hypothetical protein
MRGVGAKQKQNFILLQWIYIHARSESRNNSREPKSSRRVKVPPVKLSLRAGLFLANLCRLHLMSGFPLSLSATQANDRFL